VLNQYNEVVAFRTVIFSPGETCICSLNCKCTCAEEPKFRCIPLSDDEILSAGFPDPQEFDNYGDELSDFLTPENLLYTIAVVALILILLGKNSFPFRAEYFSVWFMLTLCFRDLQGTCRNMRMSEGSKVWSLVF